MLVLGALHTGIAAAHGQTCFGLTPTLTGAGEIVGTAGADVIVGSAGKDVIDGAGGGANVLDGGAGKDSLLLQVEGATSGHVLDRGEGSDKCRVDGGAADAVNCEKLDGEPVT